MKNFFTWQKLECTYTIFFFLIPYSYAQFNDYTAKIGLQFNGLLPDTEFDKDQKVDDADFKFSYSARAFFKI